MDSTPVFKAAARAAIELNRLDDGTVNAILLKCAEKAEQGSGHLVAENSRDLDKMEPSNPMYDRLMLTPGRISSIASDMRNVASRNTPSGRILYETSRGNGLRIRKVSVPFGVIGVIYEARPNVTFDVFSLCLKSGNACILKGGSDAISSNEAIVQLIREVLAGFGVNENIISLLPSGREETIQLMKARDYVDLIIPRGSQALIEYVRKNSIIPVIETGAGICHAYFDESGDREKGKAIVFNAKTRRVSVCNALDTLVIHASRLEDLGYIIGPCAQKEVVVYADDRSFSALAGSYPGHLLQHALEESFGTEFLSYKMSVKTAGSIDEALDHIARYSSRHSESIIAEDKEMIDRFCRQVDAAAVYSNAPTSFTDGVEFGLGAEIGISTQKLHARGPMGLEELNTYKWIIEGDGQVRP
jgi:glutamate-5-semialdehyde dehydrogenase